MKSKNWKNEIWKLKKFYSIHLVQNTVCKKMLKINHLRKSVFWNFFGIFNVFEKLRCQFKFSFFNIFEFFLHSNTHWYLVVLGRTKNETLFWASFQEVGFFGLDQYLWDFGNFIPKSVPMPSPICGVYIYIVVHW